MESVLLKDFDPRGGIILIEAVITGPHASHHARLVFDTGATHCMLPWRVINGLGIEINPKRTIETTTASAIERSPLVILPTVEVLGEKVQEVSCLVRDLPPLTGVDGLLGLSFLKNFNLSIDFEEGEIELSRFID